MSDPLDVLKSLVSEIEFGRMVRRKLTGLRFVSESDEQTLDRALAQARKTICAGCKGDGRNILGSPCRQCHGTGERAYDPNLKLVGEVMDP